VDSPLFGAGIEIPVDLYDEEEVWESQTAIVATIPLLLTSLISGIYTSPLAICHSS